MTQRGVRVNISVITLGLPDCEKYHQSSHDVKCFAYYESRTLEHINKGHICPRDYNVLKDFKRFTLLPFTCFLCIYRAYSRIIWHVFVCLDSSTSLTFLSLILCSLFTADGLLIFRILDLKKENIIQTIISLSPHYDILSTTYGKHTM